MDFAARYPGVTPLPQGRNPRPGRKVVESQPGVLAVKSVPFGRRHHAAAVISADWPPLTAAPWNLVGPAVVLCRPEYLPPDPAAVLTCQQAYELSAALIAAGELLDTSQRGQRLQVTDTVTVTVEPHSTPFNSWFIGDIARVRDLAWPTNRSDNTPNPGLAITRPDCDAVAHALRRMARDLRKRGAA